VRNLISLVFVAVQGFLDARRIRGSNLLVDGQGLAQRCGSRRPPPFLEVAHADAGVTPPSYATLKRRLRAYAREGFREKISAACAAHAGPDA